MLMRKFPIEDDPPNLAIVLLRTLRAKSEEDSINFDKSYCSIRVAIVQAKRLVRQISAMEKIHQAKEGGRHKPIKVKHRQKQEQLAWLSSNR
jgi:hypothetical protein